MFVAMAAAFSSIELQEEVRCRVEEYGSEGAAFYNIIKSNPKKYKINYQSREKPFE